MVGPFRGHRRRKHGMLLRLSALLVLALSIDAWDDQGGVGSCGSPSGPVYVSFVMVGRVDSLRGDYVGRLRNSVQFIQALCKAHGVRAEIVIVEWNPLPGWDSLADVLRPYVATEEGTPRVRVVTVPAAFHRRVGGSTGQSFFEFMAKNVGARRVRVHLYSCMPRHACVRSVLLIHGGGVGVSAGKL